MMFFDSHCHLDMEPLRTEQEEVIERAHRAGVTGIINIGSSLRGSRASVELAEKYPNIWASVGIHPHDAETIMDLDETLDELKKLTLSDKVVAIGEIGLDYFLPTGEKRKIDKNRQRKLFQSQLLLAMELGLPVVIHSREADHDTLEIIQGLKSEGQLKLTGVVHCFTGSPEFAQKLLDMGFYIGFTGFITFEQTKFDYIRELLNIVPLNKILIETDAPFLAPEPYRGKPNEPAYVTEVAKKVAEIKKMELSQVAENTVKNTKLLFNIKDG